MSMPRGTILAILLGLGFLHVFGVGAAIDDFGKKIGATIAGAYYAETTTPERLQQDYAKRSIKVLVVPGHDKVHSGTEYKGVTEAELNVSLGSRIANLLAADDRFDAQITREESGEFTSWFSDYKTREAERIARFRDERRGQFADATREGFVTREQKVEHNSALSKVADDLYAVNKYANDGAIDLVLHVHWNDYPGRRKDKAPKYSGFAIYVPDGQLPNSRASHDIATAIKDRLSPYFAVSNHSQESAGIIPDQDLIATGSNASQKKASILIEYGYIYESQYTDPATREALLDELAIQTYRGIVDFFEGKEVQAKGVGAILPHEWLRKMKQGENESKDVLALQAALIEENLYPPAGKSLHECPLSGNFGACTKTALSAFQEKFADTIFASGTMTGDTGVAGEATIELLNNLYGKGSRQ